jgi:hypothetical protein
MDRKTVGLVSAAALLAALCTPASAIPITGIEDPLNNNGEFNFSVENLVKLRVEVGNTSNYNARITGFGFDISDGIAVALWSVTGTLDDGHWRFAYGGFPRNAEFEAFAITGPNLNGGDPRSGIAVGSTGIFDFAGLFSSSLSVSNLLARFQQTGADGEGSDGGILCTNGCAPTLTQIDEPSAALLTATGIGLLMLVGVARVRRRGRAISL